MEGRCPLFDLVRDDRTRWHCGTCGPNRRVARLLHGMNSGPLTSIKTSLLCCGVVIDMVGRWRPLLLRQGKVRQERVAH